jgi:hypothetical protein
MASFTAPSVNAIRWERQDGKCFAWEGMKRLRIADRYVCGVIHRIECRLDVLEVPSTVPYTVNPKLEAWACIMAGTGSCGGHFRFRL